MAKVSEQLLNPPNPLYERGNNNFWLKLKKPILALAPMAGITDSAFRVLCREMGADVVYSEMVSADALYYNSKKTLELLKINKREHPVVVQLFGKRPELFGKAAKIAEESGADGIDINFGCPARKVVRHNGGVALMRDLPLCKKIVQSVLDAVDIPVSVKIRAGIDGAVTLSQRACAELAEGEIKGDFSLSKSMKLDKIPPTPPLRKGGTALDFVKYILDLPISAIMVHGRTYEQWFNGEVDYEMMKDVVDLVKNFSCRNEALPRSYNRMGGNIIILGNGGIKNAEDAKDMLEKTGIDGVGIGQGVLGKPWLFKEIKEYLRCRDANFCVSASEIKKIALKHTKLAYKMKGDHGVMEMRKHLLWYVKGWPNAKILRDKLVKVESVKDVKQIFWK